MVLVASVCLLLASLTYTTFISADSPWPTPPPGPQPPVPKVIDGRDIRPVQVSSVPGSAVWIVPPLAMVIPRFPPVPSSTFESPDGVRIIIDAGSLVTTVQLLYEPTQIGEAQSAGPRAELRKVFDLRAFDHQGKKTTLNLMRPWVLEVQGTGLLGPLDDPARLLIARYEEDRGWVPLVTSYHHAQDIFHARILKIGRFALLAERRDISG